MNNELSFFVLTFKDSSLADGLIKVLEGAGQAVPDFLSGGGGGGGGGGCAAAAADDDEW